MRRLPLLLLVLTAATASAEVRTGSFRSPALGRDVGYAVDLPASYAEGDRRYPVVYALHGLFEGSAFWERRGLAPILKGLEEQGAVAEMIVVAVDGGNSFFVNAPGGAFEDLVTTDLIAHVEATYRAVPGRAGRALLGISMGGYGALRMAFHRPEAFAAAATHSAMLLEKVPSPQEGAGRWHMAAFNRVFGDPIDAELWSSADPLRLVEKADAKALPLLYFDCGTEDRFGLFVGNKDLHERLVARGVKHEFGLYPGDHGYEYVRSVLERSLRFLGAALQPAGAKAAAAPAAGRN
jgi:S-formylglutathione hydrolase FrmB